MSDRGSSLLPPDPGDPSPAPPVRRADHITCEFCQCTLAPSGEYIRLSDRAKELRDQGETIDRLRADLTESEAQIAEAGRLLDEARAHIARLEAPSNKKPALW